MFALRLWPSLESKGMKYAGGSGTDAVYLYVLRSTNKRVGCEFITSIEFLAAMAINRTNQETAAAYFVKSGHRNNILRAHTKDLGGEGKRVDKEQSDRC